MNVSEFPRVAVASRAFTLAAIFGLALAFQNAAAIQSVLVVSVIAALASYLTHGASVPSQWALAAESGIASLVVVLALPEAVLVLPYLVAVPLLAGLARGLRGAAVTIGTQLAAILVLALTEGTSALEEQSELLAPWILTIIGSGLLGAWIKKLGKAPATPRDETYETARRLLGQLRGLTRRLSSGLDPVTIAGEVLSLVAAPHQRAAVFVRTEGGMFTPLAHQGGPSTSADLGTQDALLEQCWEGRAWVERHASTKDGAAEHVTTAPMRVGSGMVAVLLIISPEPVSEAERERIQDELDELSLRLDTALAFDEVRAVVTVDERQRLAREIHDGVAQEIASLGYVVDEIGAMTTEPGVRSALKDLRQELSRVVNELRLSIFDLRSDTVNSGGLGSALSDYVRRVGARSSMTVHLTLDEAPTRLVPSVETELFRIAQEAITNARKHANADNLWVDCQVHPPAATILVRDDGQGLGVGRSDSYGLRIMQERAERIGGVLTVEPNDASGGTGTCVTVSLPGTRSTLADTEGREAAR